ncbi:hypothetical protein Leryth_024384, partial [Lithospermum erythrorhizon]
MSTFFPSGISLLVKVVKLVSKLVVVQFTWWRCTTKRHNLVSEIANLQYHF